MAQKKRTWALLAALWAAALICAGATARSFHAGIGLPVETEAAESAYVLRAKNGYVAVYATDAPGTPVEVTDIAVNGLRAHDQELLRAGVPVRDREALLMLLEDLGA